MKILWRTCEKQATISHVARWKNSSKLEILKKCFFSLVQGLEDSDELYIIQDQVSESTLEWIAKKVPSAIFIDVPPHPWDYHLHTVKCIKTLAEITENCDLQEFIFLVEDDYLFTPNALQILKSVPNNWPGFVAPQDYPDRYLNSEITQIALGKYCHWRSIKSTTMTIMASSGVWQKHLKKLQEAAPTSNDKIFEEIFQNTPCINPLPGVASHLTPHHMTPFVNWEQRWKNINID